MVGFVIRKETKDEVCVWRYSREVLWWAAGFSATRKKWKELEPNCHFRRRMSIVDAQT